MTLIIDRPHFKLRLTTRDESLELHQLHPQAQRPHWRRITQLNLKKTELATLIEALQEAHDAASS